MDPRFTENFADGDVDDYSLSQYLLRTIVGGEIDLAMRMLDRWPQDIDVNYGNGHLLGAAARLGSLALVLRLLEYPELNVQGGDYASCNALYKALSVSDPTPQHFEIASVFLKHPSFDHLKPLIDYRGRHSTALECVYRIRDCKGKPYPWMEVLRIFDIETLEAEISRSDTSGFRELLVNHLEQARSVCVRQVLSLRNASVSLIGEDVLIRMIVLICWNRLHGKTEREKIADVMRIFRRFATGVPSQRKTSKPRLRLDDNACGPSKPKRVRSK